MFAQVLLDTPVKHVFTYRLPDSMHAVTGMRCQVPFGRREVTAFIVETADQLPDTSYEIKEIKRMIDKEPLFGKAEVELAQWMGRFYVCSPGEALAAMVPSGRRDIGLPPFECGEFGLEIEPEQLSEPQRRAIDSILSSSSSLHYLYGVTGSGKSEVFLRVAQAMIERNLQVIYLVPEITLTHQLARQVMGRFKNRVAVLHSGLTPSQRLAEWKRIKRGEVDVAIGARSAVFAPFERLGLIIIDEEHENSYKAGATPRYHARQVAQRRAVAHKAMVLMGSATPSLESWQMMAEGVVVRHDLPFRVAGGAPPAISIVDMLGETRTLSRRLLSEIDHVLNRDKQVILFLNRRGFSYFFHCRSCGFEMTCPHCSVALTFHKEHNRMVCHYCGFRQEPVQACPDCSSLDVGYSGFGTEMVEEEVAQAFPTARVARLDTDAARQKNAVAKILDDFREGRLDILLGTQMVAKGLNFPLVELVGIVNADSSLNLPDFRSQERAFSLIVQVSGRSGRYNDQGKVVVQTYRADNPAVMCATTGRFAQFYEQELAIRRETGFPPFSRMVNFTLRSRSKEKSHQAVEALAALTEQLLSAMRHSGGGEGLPELFGHAPCPLERIAGNWRHHLVIRGREAGRLLWLASLLEERFTCPSGVYMEIDVDPLQLL